MFLDQCCDCTCPSVGGETFVESQALVDTTSSADVVFSTFARGNYRARYCEGAFIFTFVSNPSYPHGRWSVSNTGGPTITMKYKTVGGSTATKQLIVGQPAQVEYPDQATTEAAYAGEKTDTMCHQGGTIAMALSDSPFTDNINGTPNPLVGLYLVPYDDVGTLSVVNACAQWISQGSTATVTFRVTSTASCPDITSVSAVLDTSGGITSPSGPSAWTVNIDGTASVTFTFSASTPNVTASLILTPPSSGPQTLSVFLGPIITRLSTTNPSGPSGTCGGHYWSNAQILFKNTGYWKLGPNAVISFSVLQPDSSFGACSPVASLTVPFSGPADCNGGTALVLFNLKGDGSPHTITVTALISDAQDSYGTITTSINVTS